MAAAFVGVLRQLRRQERNLSGELGRVRQAIAALSASGGRGSRAASSTSEAPVRRRRRRLSAAARARISAAQKRRWAKLKAKG
jgi:hypothetical protein